MPLVLVNSLETGSGINERLSVVGSPLISWFIFLLEHRGIDRTCNFPKFLSLMQGSGSNKISMQKDTKVIDSLFKISIGKLGDP